MVEFVYEYRWLFRIVSLVVFGLLMLADRRISSLEFATLRSEQATRRCILYSLLWFVNAIQASCIVIIIMSFFRSLPGLEQ
jgi:hypothetical protein